MRFTKDEVLHELDESSITFAEAEAIEEVCGLPFHLVGAQVMVGALRPQRALAWITLKRVDPLVKFEDLASFPIESIVWHFESVAEELPKKTRSKDSRGKSQPLEKSEPTT